jgi:hypothetical protein
MKNFDRQYRMTAGKPGSVGFEIGGTSPYALHISFSVQKQELESSNTAKVQVWNLNKANLATLEEKDCYLTLKAGYGNTLPVILSGTVSHSNTKLDGADTLTEIEVVDGLAEIRDTWVSISYAGKVNSKKIIDDIASQMGVTVTYSYNAEFADIPNGFSFVGQAKHALSKACAVSGLEWSIQNGVLQVKKPGDVMSKEVYVISPETGLISIPERVQISSSDQNGKNQVGYDLVYLMNGAIGPGDYVQVDSKYLKGFFRVYSLEIDGDNLGGAWQCKARVLEVV